jgi:hypothetical protein
VRYRVLYSYTITFLLFGFAYTITCLPGTSLDPANRRVDVETGKVTGVL